MKSPSIFLSHSSIDKTFARRLAEDLRSVGVTVWVDEAEIKVGESLITKIGDGIERSSYLAVVLSPNSVRSRWVKQEVEIAMNNEITRRKVMVLPILFRKCKIPSFLKNKLYADFSNEESYGTGFIKLCAAIGIASEKSRNVATQASRPLRLCILTTGNFAYSREVIHALQGALENAEQRTGRRVESYVVTGALSLAPSIPSAHQWRNAISVVQSRLQKADHDYLICVGTEGCANLHKSLKPSLEKLPLVFAGVTYPVEVGLVTRLVNRNDHQPIAGVKYGNGVERNAEIIARVFAHKQLIYIYQRGILQDEIGASKLESHPLHRLGRLRIVATRHVPKLSDMREQNCVYFSWLTAERVLESAEGHKILRERIFVPASRAYVATAGLAVLAVAADDKLVGKLAALIILDNIEHGKPLGTMDIQVAPTTYWVNCKTAQERGVYLEQDILTEAAEYFT